MIFMLNNGYNTRESLSSKEELQFQVIHHRKHFDESLESLNKKLESLITYAYSGDIIKTVRVAQSFKSESEYLTSHIDHLLLMLEKLAEPDHGGE